MYHEELGKKLGINIKTEYGRRKLYKYLEEQRKSDELSAGIRLFSSNKKKSIIFSSYEIREEARKIERERMTPYMERAKRELESMKEQDKSADNQSSNFTLQEGSEQPQKTNERNPKQIELEILKRKRKRLLVKKNRLPRKVTLTDAIIYTAGLMGVSLVSTLILGTTTIPIILSIIYAIGVPVTCVGIEMRKEDKLLKEINALDYHIDKLDLELNGRELPHSYINDLSFDVDPKEFDVLAVPCDRAFVVASEKAEEFKNLQSSHDAIQQAEEMADTFKVNNLGEDGPRLVKKRILQKKQ